jgi:hypothetical protein
MIAVNRETAVALFLRDYHEARRLLRTGMTVEIGHYTGRIIETEEAFHTWFMCGLNQKINTYGGILAERGQWRKWDDEYQVRLWRDQRRLWEILNQRYRIYQFETDEVRRRFGHLLACREDD